MGSHALLSSAQAGDLLAEVSREAGLSGFALPIDSSLCRGDWCFRLGRRPEHVDIRLEADLTLSADLASDQVRRALIRAEARLTELAVQWGLKEAATIGARARRSELAER